MMRTNVLLRIYHSTSFTKNQDIYRKNLKINYKIYKFLICYCKFRDIIVKWYRSQTVLNRFKPFQTDLNRFFGFSVCKSYSRSGQNAY